MKKAFAVPLILLGATTVAAGVVFVRHRDLISGLSTPEVGTPELISGAALNPGRIGGHYELAAPASRSGPGGERSGALSSARNPDRNTMYSWAENREHALNIIRDGARNGNKALLEEVASLPKDCPGCQELFSSIQQLLKDATISSDEQIYLASVLAASGRAESQAFLYDEFRRAIADPAAATLPAATIARQLERNQQGGPLTGEVVDQITNDLQSDNPYLREAAISLLTRQRTREAAERLYEYTVNNADRDGFYRQGMGLGLMTPEPEAFPFLEDLVRKQDQYSHLALKALLNAGAEGVGAAINLLGELQGSVPNRALIMGAVDHIPMYGPTLKYIEGLQSSPNPTIKELAGDVIREYKSRQAALRKGIEYNENYASGIILPTPGPF